MARDQFNPYSRRPAWETMALGLRPITDPTALPAGVDRSVIANPEDEAQRAQRIAEEAARAARGADPAARIARASGGSIGRGVMAPPSDPGESLASIAHAGVTDILPGIVETGAELFGIDPESAAEAANTVRVGGQDALRRTYLTLPQGLRSAASSEFSPEAAAGRFIPFSDEIQGTWDAARHRIPWRVATDAASERLNDLAEQYPASAMAGSVAQGIASAPLFGAPSAVSEGIPSVGRGILGGLARGVREGAALGSVIGADVSEHRPFVTMYDVATGNEPASTLGTESLGFGADVAGNAILGGAMSGAAGAVLGGLGARGRQLRLEGQFGSLDDAAATRIRAYDDAIASQPSADTEFLPGLASDANVPDSTIDALTAPQLPGISDDLANYRSVVASIRDQPLALRDLPGEMFNNNADVLRANAVGVEQTRAMRALRRTMGVPQFSEALDRYGVMPRGNVSTTETYAARGAALRRAAGARQGAIESMWDDAVLSGEANPIDPQDVGTRIRVLADEYARDGEDRVAQDLYRFADQHVETLPVTDPGTGARIASSPRRALSVSEITQSLIPRARNGAMQLYDGQRLTDRQAQAWADVYRLLNDVRDESIETGLGPQAIRDYRLARNAGHVGHLIPDEIRPVRLAHRFGAMGGLSVGSALGAQIAGAPGALLGGGVGAAIGNAAGRRWTQWEPAVMAAMADPAAGSVAARARGVLGNIAENLTSPIESIAAPATASRIARAVAATPESFGRYSRLLTDAARRGTLDAVLHHIAANDPDAAEQIRAAIPIEQAEQLPSTEVDPNDPGRTYREGGSVEAPPPVPDDPELDPNDPGRRYR